MGLFKFLKIAYKVVVNGEEVPPNKYIKSFKIVGATPPISLIGRPENPVKHIEVIHKVIEDGDEPKKSQ